MYIYRRSRRSTEEATEMAAKYLHNKKYLCKQYSNIYIGTVNYCGKTFHLRFLLSASPSNVIKDKSIDPLLTTFTRLSC